MIPLMVVGCIVVGGLSFFGGMKYEQTKSSANGRQINFQNLSPEERQQRFQQMGGNGNGARRIGNGQIGGGFVNGEVLSKDDKSITLKLVDGGSKILFLSSSTTIMQATPGTVNDIQVGQTISANGNTNSDGSISAQMIQLRSVQR